MAIVRYAGDRYTCLSTDTKPTDVVAGAWIIETNTGLAYFYTGSVWQLIGGASSGSNLGTGEEVFKQVGTNGELEFRTLKPLAGANALQMSTTGDEILLTVNAVHSVMVDGAGIIELVNDTGSPGNDKVYGTNGSGTKGWKDDTGLKHFSESYNTSTPNTTTSPVVAFTALGAGPNKSIALKPSGNGGLLAAIPDNTSFDGEARGILSIDFQLSRSLADQVASGSRAILVGGINNKAAGLGSIIIGSSGSTVSSASTNGVIVGCDSADVTNNYSAIIGGQNITVGGAGSLASGFNTIVNGSYSAGFGTGCSVSGAYAFVCGRDNTVTNNYSAALAGYDNTVSGFYCATISGFNHTITDAASFSTIAYGNNCNITGDYSLAGGLDAHADADYTVSLGRESKANHQGSFIFSDSQTADHTSTQINEMRLRFQNGVYVNGDEVLTEATGLPKLANVIDLGTGGGTTAISTTLSGNVYYARPSISTRSLRLDSSTIGTQVEVHRNGTGIVQFTQGTSQTIIQGSTVQIKDKGAAVAICVATNTWSVVGSV